MTAPAGTNLVDLARQAGLVRPRGSNAAWSFELLVDLAVSAYWRNRQVARPVGQPLPDHLADLCGLRRCGTPAGRERHYRRSEQPCETCAGAA